MRIRPAMPNPVSPPALRFAPAPQVPSTVTPTRPIRTDSVVLSPAARSSISPQLQSLVAARVDVPVEFTPAAGPPTSRAVGDALPMHGRPADRVDAAIDIRIGQSLDVRG